MTTINELNSVVVKPDSLINGAITDYDIIVTVNTPLVNTDKFTITFPSEITLPVTADCDIGSGVTSVSCMRNANKITATLSFSGGTVLSGKSFTFTLKGVKNPTDTRPSS